MCSSKIFSKLRRGGLFHLKNKFPESSNSQPFQCYRSYGLNYRWKLQNDLFKEMVVPSRNGGLREVEKLCSLHNLFIKNISWYIRIYFHYTIKHVNVTFTLIYIISDHLERFLVSFYCTKRPHNDLWVTSDRIWNYLCKTVKWTFR